MSSTKNVFFISLIVSLIVSSSVTMLILFMVFQYTPILNPTKQSPAQTKAKPNFKTFFVPPLVGMPVEKARLMIEKKGGRLQVAKKFSKTHPKKVVLTQFPKQGQSILKGQKVFVSISLGPKPNLQKIPENSILIPNIIGKPIALAKKLIRAKGLKIKKVVYDYDQDVKENHVLRQIPQFGKHVKKNSSVTIVINRE